MLSERELVLVELLADIGDNRTKEAKCQSVGYAEKTVYRLQRKPEFKEAIRQRIAASLSTNLPKVYRTLVDLATRGRSVKAAELLLKASGHIQSGGQTNVTNIAQQKTDDDDESFVERLKRWREQRGVAHEGTDETN